VQVEVDPGASKRLDLLPGPGAHVLEPSALGAEDDRFWLGRSTYSSACTSVRSSDGMGAISSTTRRSSAGAPRVPLQRRSRMSSATSSVPARRSVRLRGTAGCLRANGIPSTSTSTSRLNRSRRTPAPRRPLPSGPPRRAGRRLVGDTSSVLVTMATTGVPLIRPARGPGTVTGPIASPAGIQKPMTSTSVTSSGPGCQRPPAASAACAGQGVHHDELGVRPVHDAPDHRRVVCGGCW